MEIRNRRRNVIEILSRKRARRGPSSNNVEDDLAVEVVTPDLSQPKKVVRIESYLTAEVQVELLSFLKENLSCFAWSHKDLVGIDASIITHKLDINPRYKPVRQKRRKFAPERNNIINEEVERLLETDKIRVIHYPDWLSNVVVV